MKTLRGIRIALAVLFFAAAIAFLCFDKGMHPALRVVQTAQIVPSAIATGMGAVFFWIIMSFLLGRVYCSTVCPVGTVQDVVIRLRRRIPGISHRFRYQPPRQVRYHILIIYVLSLLVGVMAVAYWIEPWNIMRNVCAAVNPDDIETTWLTLGVGMGAGIAAGFVTLVSIAVCSLFTGRGFCTDVCPIGTALGSFHSYTLFHIEIDPDKCINCMKCEEVCKSQCVKVVGRYVDNSRCVRCFDCGAVCPNDAIRFQMNRNRRGMPMLRMPRRERL